MAKGVFLTARWEKLLIANFQATPEQILPWVPSGTEPDDFNGEHLVSLVAFQFLNTRVLGIRFPFHTHFTEVNLRIYVKRNVDGKWRRGVVFIKEIVPRVMITFIANTLYDENYETMRTGSNITSDHQFQKIKYTWGREHYFSCEAKSTPQEIRPGSLEEFVTEHYWGYAGGSSGNVTEYGVEHPRWRVFPIKDYSMSCDFKKIYGNGFAWIDQASVHSVLLAEGSDIIVRKGNKIQ